LYTGRKVDVWSCGVILVSLLTLFKHRLGPHPANSVSCANLSAVRYVSWILAIR
jgi:hypothetical protein